MIDDKQFRLTATVAMQKLELQKLNSAIQRKNYAIESLRERLSIARAQNKLLRSLPPVLVDANGRRALHPAQMSEEDAWAMATMKYPEGYAHLDEELLDEKILHTIEQAQTRYEFDVFDSENPDSGKV
jgi:hypothetical protein